MDGDEAGPGYAVPNLAHWILMVTAIALTVIAPVRLLHRVCCEFSLVFSLQQQDNAVGVGTLDHEPA